jgi:hypothetical protein
MILALPPHYVSAPPGDVYSRDLSDPHFRTLTQIRGLAWRTRGERTPPLTIDDLMQIRGLSRTQMFEHLRWLRENGHIRIELVSDGLFVILPLLSGGQEATFSTSLSPDELAALTGSDEHLPGSSPENRTPSPENRTQHVVVDSHDSGHEQQQHVFESGKPDSNGNLLSDLAAVLVACGGDVAKSRALAGQLLTTRGPEVCDRQLAVFERRQQIALASPRGLQNPAGLLIDSIRGDWDPPPDEARREEKRWFTDEEAEQFFVH